MKRKELVPMSPGWIVQLYSGGPRMTVNGVNQKTGMVDCVWFDEHGFNGVTINIHAVQVLDMNPGVTITATPE